MKQERKQLIWLEHPLRATPQDADCSMRNKEIVDGISGSGRAEPSAGFECEDSSHVETRRMRDLQDIGLQISASQKRRKNSSRGFSLLDKSSKNITTCKSNKRMKRSTTVLLGTGSKNITTCKSNQRIKRSTTATSKATHPAKRRKKKPTDSAKGRHKSLTQVLEKSKIQAMAEGVERLNQSNMSDSTLTCLSDVTEAKSSYKTHKQATLELGCEIYHKVAKRQTPHRHGTRWQGKRRRNIRKCVSSQVCKANYHATAIGCRKTSFRDANNLVCSASVKNWFPIIVHFDYVHNNNWEGCISLMSEMTGRSIIGYPVSVEMIVNSSEASEHAVPSKVSRTKKKLSSITSGVGLTAWPQRKLKSQNHMSPPSFLKKRSLSSIADNLFHSTKCNITEYTLEIHVKESQARTASCIPVHTVFDRLREALS